MSEQAREELEQEDQTALNPEDRRLPPEGSKVIADVLEVYNTWLKEHRTREDLMFATAATLAQNFINSIVFISRDNVPDEEIEEGQTAEDVVLDFLMKSMRESCKATLIDSDAQDELNKILKMGNGTSDG